MFLENVRQEMPKAHLELLHSGSLCVTAEAFRALALPGRFSNPLLCVLYCHCMKRMTAGVSNKSLATS